MELQFEKFDLKNLVYDQDGNFLNPRIAIIAKSGSGKSWVIREILYYFYKTKVPCGTVIAPTDKMNKFYDDFIPPAFIHHTYKEEILTNLLKRQKTILEKNNQRVKENKEKIDPRAYFVMDDCMSSKNEWLKDPKMLSIFNEGRHFQITFLLSMQFSLGIQPELRSNFNFIFLLGEDTFSNRKRLYEHYAGIFPTRELFEMAFAELTNDYGCMVINNNIRSNDITKKVFYFKASKTPNFKLGTQPYLKYNEDNFDPDHDKKTSITDLSQYIYNNKRKTNVQIKKV